MKKHNFEFWAFLFSVFIGGFSGAYAILRCDVFASSQTINLVMLAFAVFGRNLKEFFIRIIIVMFYALGIVAGVIIPKYTRWNIKYVSLCVTTLTALLLGILFVDYKNEIVLIPIFFAMSVQWNAFTGAGEYQAANVFLTNNFRLSVMGITNFLCTKERKFLKQFLFYFVVILSYLFGSGTALLLMNLMGFSSVLFLLVPVILIFLLLIGENAKK